MASTSSSRLIAADRRRRALNLRKSGASIQQIADQLEISAGAVHRYLAQAYEALNTEFKESAVEVRALELERLDELLLMLWPKVRQGDLKAMDRVLRIMERRSSLLGLDAPAKHQHQIEVGDGLQIEREEIDRLNKQWEGSVEGTAREVPAEEMLLGDGDDSR